MTTTAEQDAEAQEAMLVLGGLQWTEYGDEYEREHRALSASGVYIVSEYWDEQGDEYTYCFQHHCVRFESAGREDVSSKEYYFVEQAKDACANHAATGQW